MTKKIVHYDVSYGVFPIGDRVVLHPINHTDSNTSHVLTSPVVTQDFTTGVIETENTIYKPEEDLTKPCKSNFKI